MLTEKRWRSSIPLFTPAPGVSIILSNRPVVLNPLSIRCPGGQPIDTDQDRARDSTLPCNKRNAKATSS